MFNRVIFGYVHDDLLQFVTEACQFFICIRVVGEYTWQIVVQPTAVLNLGVMIRSLTGLYRSNALSANELSISATPIYGSPHAHCSEFGNRFHGYHPLPASAFQRHR